MEFDYRKLLGKITEVCGTQAEFAKRIRMSERSVSLKLNGRVEFKQSEIATVCDVLGIKDEQIGEYFFKCNVQIA